MDDKDIRIIKYNRKWNWFYWYHWY